MPLSCPCHRHSADSGPTCRPSGTCTYRKPRKAAGKAWREPCSSLCRLLLLTCYLPLTDRYSTAAEIRDGSSLNMPRAVLQLLQSNPRTLPVAWLWSTNKRLPLSFFREQIAHKPPCLLSISANWVAEIPYFRFIRYPRNLSEFADSHADTLLLWATLSLDMLARRIEAKHGLHCGYRPRRHELCGEKLSSFLTTPHALHRFWSI